MELLLKSGFSPKELEQLYGYLDRIHQNIENAEKIFRREIAK